MKSLTKFKLKPLFPIILSILCLASCTTNAKKDQASDDLQDALSTYKDEVRQDESNLEESYDKLSNSLHNSMDVMIENSRGDEKKFYTIVKRFLLTSDSVNRAWNKSYEAFNDTLNLDYTKLIKTGEYGPDREIVESYVANSEYLRSYTLNRKKELNKRFRYINENTDFYKSFIKGFNQKDSAQRIVFEPYINAHIAYGKAFLNIIQLLEREHGYWSYEDDVLYFERGDGDTEYNELLEVILEKEPVINELSMKLLDTM